MFGKMDVELCDWMGVVLKVLLGEGDVLMVFLLYEIFY